MKMNLYRVLKPASVLLAAALLPACKSMEVPKVPGITPYRMVIQQGNFISQEMVSQLKPGMSKEQVRFVLGTPLVTDIFHADRWDYVFFREMPDGKREQRNLSVVFEKDKLARVLGDLLPSEGAAPKADAFPQLMKPEPKPEAVAKPEPKPAAKPVAETPKPAEAPKPAAESPKPAVEAPKTAEEKQEPGFFDRLREKIGGKPAAKPVAEAPQPAAEALKPVAEAPKPAVEAPKTAEEKKEPGFFDRLREKIGL